MHIESRRHLGSARRERLRRLPGRRFASRKRRLRPLNAAFFAVVAGVGLTVFQATFPAPGLASGLFTNTRRIGAVFSGALITTAAIAPDTDRAVYFAGAAATLLVAIGVLARREAAVEAPEEP